MKKSRLRLDLFIALKLVNFLKSYTIYIINGKLISEHLHFWLIWSIQYGKKLCLLDFTAPKKGYFTFFQDKQHIF